MPDNLVIVESPAKAKTIEKILGGDYTVKSSYGHIRDLAKKGLGVVEPGSDFTPIYEVSDDKQKVVAELKKLASKAKTVWLASDEDREGEAIAWHLSQVLGLDPDTTKRIVFHEITKGAILDAVEHPRTIDINLVNSQQARRVLDRLVGFELSPVLWRKIKPSLSAGRVQSVAVRLIVEREKEILAFKANDYFKVAALFDAVVDGKPVALKADLDKKFETPEQAHAFLEHCASAGFRVDDIETKPGKRSPAPPFTTSTLQQEASRKLGFSVSQTMRVAQQLYENGLITYMRTDSVNLSNDAIAAISGVVTENYGKEYLHVRRYTTKAKGAQEAHEAIRPSYMSRQAIEGTAAEQRLYSLIWKRSVASQMADALLEKTVIDIVVSGKSEKFVATGEVIRFDGFIRLYTESIDDESDDAAEGLLPAVKKGDALTLVEMDATQKYTQRPPRYTEASLVKRLEDLGIGRPSTYAPTLSTIIARGYVVKENRDGEKRTFQRLTLRDHKIASKTLTETHGAEKAKLFPTDIGIVVNDYLAENFPSILDYGFTANVEEQFDEIASGHLGWTNMLHDFYGPFHSTVEKATEEKGPAMQARLLGVDPVSGKNVYARIGRFGPLVQIGETDDPEKPRFANLQPGQLVASITLDEALKLFVMPRELGDYEDKKVSVGIGRFGPYVKHDGKFVSLKKGVDDPYGITLTRAIELIEEKRRADSQKVIKTFAEDADLQLLNGRWGPYISYRGENYKLPKGADPAALTHADCMKIIAEQPHDEKKAKPKFVRKKK